MRRHLLTVLAIATLSCPALAEHHKLGNSHLKDEGFERLEGSNTFRIGCRYIIRSEDRLTTYHPTVITTSEIGLAYNGQWVTVKSGDKTTLSGVPGKVTTWRNCEEI